MESIIKKQLCCDDGYFSGDCPPELPKDYAIAFLNPEWYASVVDDVWINNAVGTIKAYAFVSLDLTGSVFTDIRAVIRGASDIVSDNTTGTTADAHFNVLRFTADADEFKNRNGVMIQVLYNGTWYDLAGIAYQFPLSLFGVSALQFLSSNIQQGPNLPQPGNDMNAISICTELTRLWVSAGTANDAAVSVLQTPGFAIFPFAYNPLETGGIMGVPVDVNDYNPHPFGQPWDGEISAPTDISGWSDAVGVGYFYNLILQTGPINDIVGTLIGNFEGTGAIMPGVRIGYHD